MAQRISLRSKRTNRTLANSITPWICCECGNELRDRERVILVEVYAPEEVKRLNSKTKVKARRWFCDNYHLQAWLTRVTTRQVPKR